MSSIVLRPLGGAGTGLPAGGTAGQVLARASGGSLQWVDQPAAVDALEDDLQALILVVGAIDDTPDLTVILENALL